MVFFRQLYDATSSTYTYILACEETKEAVVIDPVIELVNRDVALMKELKLNPIYEIETHVHADHITGGHALRNTYPSLSQVLSEKSGVTFTEGLKLVADGDKIKFGNYELLVYLTPGHTNGCMSLIFKDEMVFTGDALFIRGCGRTDFQQVFEFFF
jgi:sulfur dioxygenase